MSHVIVIAQSKGGAGKTTITLSLAGYWIAQGERVAIIDADGPQHHASKWVRSADDESSLRRITLITAPKNLPREIAAQAKTHDRVLIDLIGADADVLTLAIANADLVLIPVQDSPLDIDGALTTYKRLKQAEKVKATSIIFRIVMCRTQPKTALYMEIQNQLKAAGLPIAGAELQNRVLFKEGMMTGSTPTLSNPRSAAALEIAQLAREVEALTVEMV